MVTHAPSIAAAATDRVEQTILHVGAKDLLVGMVPMMGFTPVTIVALGALAAVSAALTYTNYQHRKKRLREFYSEEISAALHKPKSMVTDRDMELVAKGSPEHGIEANATIAEALKQNRRQRNISAFLSIASSLASFSMLAIGVHSELFKSFGLHGLAETLVTGALGVAAYTAVKMPLHWVADQFLGLDKTTVNDRIVNIAREHDQGKTITREQIISVFVSAHPELNDQIKQRYGKRYDELGLVDQYKVAETLDDRLHLRDMADNINASRMNCTELAFAVQGQESGMRLRDPEPMHKPSVFKRFTKRCRDMVNYVRGNEPIDTRALDIPGVFPKESLVPIEYDLPQPRISHVERLQRERAAEPQLSQQR